MRGRPLRGRRILTTLPVAAVVRAAAFSAYPLPIERWSTLEHLYSATGLAPATYLGLGDDHLVVRTRRANNDRQKSAN